MGVCCNNARAAKAQRDDGDKAAGETGIFLKLLETQTNRLDNAMSSPPAHVQPLLAPKYRSYRAGNLGPLDHIGDAYGGTISSYDELPGVLRKAKTEVYIKLGTHRDATIDYEPKSSCRERVS